ncbi:MAG: hypothetical protein AAGB19_02575 [Cyanobacteria bacterium P01_F01_bin.3]
MVSAQLAAATVLASKAKRNSRHVACRQQLVEMLTAEENRA